MSLEDRSKWPLKLGRTPDPYQDTLGYISRSSGLARSIPQGTFKGNNVVDRSSQKKIETNFVNTTTVTENRTR